MPISIHEGALYLAYAEKNARNRDVAVCVQGDRVSAVGVDDAVGANDSRTPVINILQNARVRDNAFIATTYRPKESCRGMAAMLGVDRFVYASGAGIRNLIDNGDGQWTDQPAFGGVAYNGISAFPIANFNAANEPTRAREGARWYRTVQLAAPNPGDPGNVRLNALTQSMQAAVRHTRAVGPVLNLPDQLIGGGVRVDDAARHQMFMKLAFAIVGCAFVDDRYQGFAGGHNIGCVLRGPDDRIIGWGVNSGGAFGSTYHGEVNLLQNYHRRNAGAALPNGSILYSTLEPCHMCAGMIAESGRNIAVYYGQADPGIQNNALARQHNGCNQQVLANLTGIHLDDEYNGGPITQFLTSEAAEGVLLEARDRYMDARPDGAADRAIWRDGVGILELIDPNIRAYRNV